MAVYKVPQDVEAEDKFFGPFTFKQFLLGGGAGVLGYLMFLFASKEIWFIVAMILPVFLVLAILAIPWSKDQPTELWLASRIRFFIVPRKRIWDQSGMKDLVEITVPKREVHVYTDGLTQDQVRSRLNALASVVDTRGWAVKNIRVGDQGLGESDRLVAGSTTAQSDDKTILDSTNDMMDERANPIAQQFNSMIQQSEDKHRQETLAKIQAARQQRDTGPALPPVQPIPQLSQAQPQPMPEPQLSTFQSTPIVQPAQATPAPITHVAPALPAQPTLDEAQLLEQVHRKKQQDADILSHSHMKALRPLAEQEEIDRANAQAAQAFAEANTFATTQQTASATPVDPAILALADNDDLSVETLARQAKRDMPDEGEVIISLH